MLKTKLSWAGRLSFEGKGEFGHTITVDGSKSEGGDESGHKPTELLMWGIAACTGMDIVGILKKQRQQLESLDIEVVGHHNDEYPRRFHTIEVRYVVWGKDIDPTKLERAIELSQEKYCIVSQTVKNPATVTTSYEILTK